MNKNDIKKIIISIIFVVFLVILFLLIKNYNERKINKNISLVKKIISEKYDKVVYKNKSKYMYSYIKEDGMYTYYIFDLHGNKKYSFKSDKKLNIITVMKNYFITYDEEYHLYNKYNELIRSGKVIEGLNDYIIRVNNQLIDIDNEVLLDNVKKIKAFNNNKHFNINDYYLLDKKGNILLENIIIKEEIKTNNITDYYIVKKSNKYYTFFININKIIGDGFDSYSLGKNTYIKTNKDTYKIYKTGFRKKIKTNTVSFNKFKKGKIDSYSKISKDYYKLRVKDKYYIYNNSNNKTIYTFNKNIKNIIIFEDNYISYKLDNTYYLINKNNKTVITSDRQIIIKKDIIAGSINKNVSIYDLKNRKIIEAEKIIINDNIYYKYDNHIISNDFKNDYYSMDYITYNDLYIIYKKDNTINFYNLYNDKIYKYELNKSEEIVNDYPLKNVLLLESDNNIKIVNTKGEVIKVLKDRKIVDYYESNRENVVIITSKEIDGYLLEGSYLAK